MAEIDSLSIEISASAKAAETSLDNLVSTLGRLSSELTSINGAGGLKGFAVSVKSISTAMQGLKDVKLPDYTRLAKGINKFSEIKPEQISRAGAAIGQLSKSLGELDKINVSDNAKQVTELAKGISQLGYKSSTQAIENIPKLATAMKDLMGTLSKAPRVSQNLIDMTNSLARLARTGASSGKAASSIATSFNGISSASLKTLPGLNKMQVGFGKLWRSIMPFIGVWQVLSFGKQSIEMASALEDVQNVVDVTFGKYAHLVETMEDTSIVDLGMGELTVKKLASRFQSMGTAVGIAQGEMAKMSIELTELAGQLTSLYGGTFEETAKSLEGIFSGETESIRSRFGIDITNATIQQWALNNGINANVNSMSQLEKTMLRFQYVTERGNIAAGDFQRTFYSWQNQVRILVENFNDLKAAIGKGLISAFRPLVIALNEVMVHITNFVETVVNALGAIFGWKYSASTSGMAEDLGTGAIASDNMADGTGTAADNLGKAAKNAKKLRDYTLGIDELNIISPDDTADDGGSGTSGSGSGLGNLGSAAGTASGEQWTQVETLFEDYESEIDTLYKLGDHIGTTLKNAMKDIDWHGVWDEARDFGKGLADFLNGLISPELFWQVGKTIAASLNTVIYSALSFGQTFDFKEFGLSIASAINGFFYTFDFEDLAESLNAWVQGIWNLITTTIKNVNWRNVLDGIGDFFKNIDIKTVGLAIGAITIKKIAALKLGTAALSLIKTSLVGTIGKGLSSLLGTAMSSSIGNAVLTSIKGLPKLISGSLKGVGTSIIKILSTALGVSGGAATAVFGVIVAGVLAVVAGIKNLWDTSETFRKNVGKMWDTITEAFANAKVMIWDEGLKPLWKGLQEFFGSLSEMFDTLYEYYESSGLKQIFEDIVTIAGNVLAQSLATAVERIGSLLKTALNVAFGIINALSGVAQFISGIFSKDWGKAWEGVKKVVSGFVSAITNLLSIGWKEIQTIFKPVSDWFGEKFSDAYKAVTESFSRIGVWFEEKWRAVQEVFKAVKEFFSEKFTSAYKSVQLAFQYISNWFLEKWNAVKNVFKTVKEFFAEKFQSAYKAVQTAFQNIVNWFQSKWNAVKNVFAAVKTFFSEKFVSAYNAVKTAFQSINAWFQDKWNAVKNVFSNVRTFFRDAFKNAYTAVTNIWDGIKNYFRNIANKIIEPIGKAVNGIIKGINWILEKVGSNVRVDLWEVPTFATGSKGLPRDTVGIVNDQRGSTYREMIVPPDGKAFIPKGRNVMLPMKKGTKIMPADETKRFIAGLPHFEGGIGEFFSNAWARVRDFTGDVMDYLTEPGKIVQIAIDKFVSATGLAQPIAAIATGTVNKVFNGVVEFIKGIFGTIAGEGVEGAVRWALNIANDNSHGYDQASRWGNPDYDCSSLVISAFENAGIKMKSAGATYTGNMTNAAKSVGFRDITNAVNRSTGSGLKRGDILLNTQNHTALYIGDGKVVQASHNEWGGISGGKPGDQTGYEIQTRSYYNYPWDKVLRYYRNGIGRIDTSEIIPGFVDGGYPARASLFYAGEQGVPELLGTIGGKTAVAGGAEITGIADAVYSTGQVEAGLLQTAVNLLQVIADKEFGVKLDTREIISATDARRARNGWDYATGKA